MPDRNDYATCHICKDKSARTWLEIDATVVRQQCAVCGDWRGSLDAVVPHLRDSKNAGLVPYLAAYIRRANASGESPVELTADNWREFAERHARTPIMRRLDLLLRWFEERSRYAGAWVQLGAGEMYPLVDALNDKEVSFLAKSLAGQGLLEPHPESSQLYRITAKGWDYLAPLSSGGIPGTCFVAMSFDPSMDPIYDNAIRPALEDDCGFKPHRVDREPHNDSITDRILAGIRAAQFVVADFTQHRQGVYYEAGFAQGSDERSSEPAETPITRNCISTRGSLCT